MKIAILGAGLIALSLSLSACGSIRVYDDGSAYINPTAVYVAEPYYGGPVYIERRYYPRRETYIRPARPTPPAWNYHQLPPERRRFKDNYRRRK